jgi:hypothetical protein
MANPQKKSIPPAAGLQPDEKTELFRRAAKAARTSKALINETEELLAQTRRLLKKSEDRLVSK